MGGHAPEGQNDASDPRFVACPGKAEGPNEAERPPALQPPPSRANGGHGAWAAPPPPGPPPAQERHGPAPWGAHSPKPGSGTAPHHHSSTQPPQGVQAKGTVMGPHTHTPAPTARGYQTPTARPVGGQSGEAERLTPDAPRNSGRHPPPPGDALPPPQQPQAKWGGTGTGPPPLKHTRRSKGPGQDTRRGTDHVEGPYQRPVPGQREVRTPHHPKGGRGDTAGARAHTHAKGTRGLPERQPDRAHGTHRPRRMANQQARVRDTQTGRPATRSAGHAGREGGNGRDTTPGTGPNPPDQPRALRTHGRGTAPSKAVVAH